MPAFFRRLGGRTTLLTMAGLAGLVLLGVFSYAAMVQMSRAEREVVHSRETLEMLGLALLVTLDAETASRGYALSGDPAYLGPVVAAEQRADEILAALHHLLDDDPAQIERLVGLETRVEDRFALSHELIDERRLRGGRAAAEFLRGGEGLQAQAEIRALVGEMVRVERAKLLGREVRSANAQLQAKAVIVISFLLVGLAFATAVRYRAVRRKIEMALRDSETLMRMSGEMARFGSWSLDVASGEMTWSDNVTRMLDMPDGRPLDFAGVMQSCEPESRERIEQALGRCIGDGIPYDLEIEMVTAEGRHIHVRVVARAERDANDRTLRVIGAMQDITELKRVERSLARSEELFRQLANSMPIIIWTAGPDGRADFVSRNFLEYAGTERADDANRLWSRAILREDREPTLEKWRVALASGGNYLAEFRMRRHDGVYRWHLVSAVPIRDPEGKVIKWIGSATDIDDRRRTEREMSDLAARLTMILESISDSFFTLDREWRFTYFNKEAERVLGRSAVDLLGKNIWEEFPPTPGRVIRNLCEKAVRENVKQSTETFYEPLGMWLSVTAYPSPEGLAFYFQDVTERRQMQDRLNQSQRLEAVGQLTGGVAHDFNNLLTVIMGNAEILGERLGADSKLHGFAEMTRVAAERGAELTGRLLSFSRQQALEPRHVDLGALIGGIGDMLVRVLGEQIEIETVAAEGLWPAEVDPGQFENAVLNLCINARDAMSEGGRLTIELSNACFAEEDAVAAGIEAGEYVRVGVSDTGTGMSRDVLDRVFEPFFTTKEVGKGSGLGLSMVYGFVKQSGGQVRIYSEPGEGTSIKLYLPRARAAAETFVPAERDGVFPVGAENILLVEDDEFVRDYVYGQLVALGYRVVAVGNGVDAMAALNQSDKFDLLFTDVVMPGGLNGRQLAEQAQARQPDLKVLFTSGYAESAVVHHGRLDRGVQLLSKPYRRSELAIRIRQVLDAPAVRVSDIEPD
ncbi:MAG: PAS domain S-box protein [Parvibaculum sp.]|nr:PAS domain S-box protein [Parvibaculum sp.]